VENAAETLSSMRFGNRASGVKCKVATNVRLDPDKLQQQLTAARAEVRIWERNRAAQEGGCKYMGLLPSRGSSRGAHDRIQEIVRLRGSGLNSIVVGL
jgi:hypothetical protein